MATPTVSFLKRQKIQIPAGRPIDCGIQPQFKPNEIFVGFTPEGQIITGNGEVLTLPKLELVNKLELPEKTHQMWAVGEEYVYLKRKGTICFRQNEYRFYCGSKSSDNLKMTKNTPGKEGSTQLIDIIMSSG